MKPDKTIRLSLFGVVAAFVMFVAGCYMMPGSGNGVAKVAINAKGIPPNLSSVALVVTAPGMATISTTASVSAGSITVSVPAGPARTFTLLLNGPSATLEGVATVDLQPGQTTTINVTPTLGATQIVIPDLQNHRVVQISDMIGTGWTAITGSSLSGTVNTAGGLLTPWAIDFDSLGRIYIASNSTIGLFRIDDISHPASPTAVLVDTTIGITSLAVDRTNGLVYYGTAGTNLNQKNVNNVAASPTILSLASETLLIGPASMAADDQGNLYMVLTYPSNFIVKYNPSLPVGSRIIARSTYAGFTTPWGVMVKGPYVYVSDNNGNGSGLGKAQIVRFDTNLNFVDSFSGPSTDPFYGPETFVATLNRKFTMIDEKADFFDRLVSFDDMAGTNWTTFGSNGAGVNQFDFYTVC
jgi:hypothetical protein